MQKNDNPESPVFKKDEELPLPWKFAQGAFETELYKELTEDHVLFGRRAETVAVRIDCDEVLFRIDDHQYAVVHLTWRGSKEISALWPHAIIYNSWNEVYEKAILTDHKGYFKE